VPAPDVFKDSQTFGPKVFSTPKFGDLTFDGSEFANVATQTIFSDKDFSTADLSKGIPEAAINLNLRINGQGFTFHPSNIIEKGLLVDKKQFYNPKVLQNLDQLYEQGQPISLKGVGWYEDFLNKNNLSTDGVLLPAGELNFNVGSGGNWKVREIGEVSDRIRFNEISGIGKIGDQYVYTANVDPVDATSAYGYYDATGARGEWTKEKGGLLGDVSRAVAQVPFLPEIAGAITSNPYVYATLKGLQAGAQNKDPIKAGLEAGATLLAADLASDFFGGAPAEAAPVGGTPGVSEVFPVDMSVGGTVTPILPGSIGLPPISLLDGVTFPGQGFKTPTIDSPDISLSPQGSIPSGLGLRGPTMPSIPGMGGGQGLTVGVPGGTVGAGGFTPTGAVPVLGDPASFINDPNVLGEPVIEPPIESISLRDAFDAARNVNRVRGLLDSGGGGGGGGGSDPGQQGLSGSVDVSQLLALLGGARARTPSIYSLLG
jgi:hypothetical protein